VQVCIFCSAGPASRCRCRLSSNVRRRKTPSRRRVQKPQSNMPRQSRLTPHLSRRQVLGALGVIGWVSSTPAFGINKCGNGSAVIFQDAPCPPPPRPTPQQEQRSLEEAQRRRAEAEAKRVQEAKKRDEIHRGFAPSPPAPKPKKDEPDDPSSTTSGALGYAGRYRKSRGRK
jgi:hypothetical protein